ncbi:MAG: hypothetical protein HW395_43 [candidate division NC10 bacterium]|nr:hypothetical protein [candidate division NC10 bacterium]
MSQYGESGGHFPGFRGTAGGYKPRPRPSKGRRTVTVACPALVDMDTPCEADVVVTLLWEVSLEEDGVHTDVDLEEWDAPCGHALTHEAEQDDLMKQAKAALRDEE